MQRNARLAILGIALIAGLLAAYLVSRSPREQIIVEAPPPAPAARVIEVLSAVGDLSIGTVLKPEQIDWRPWPVEAQSQHLIRRSDRPNAKAEFTNAIVRAGFIDGEPIRAEKVVRPDSPSGFMAAILPSGMRAVAVTIDSRGSNSAGGFILPNDRVDVLRALRNDTASRSASTEIFEIETILTNVRVLAIGHKIEEGADGQKYVTGETATLELDTQQVETVSLAQKQGSITLALRSIVDRNETPGAQPRAKEDALTIVRFGVPTKTGK